MRKAVVIVEYRIPSLRQQIIEIFDKYRKIPRDPVCNFSGRAMLSLGDADANLIATISREVYSLGQGVERLSVNNI